MTRFLVVWLYAMRVDTIRISFVYLSSHVSYMRGRIKVSNGMKLSLYLHGLMTFEI